MHWKQQKSGFLGQDKSWDGMGWSDGVWMLRGQGLQRMGEGTLHRAHRHVFVFPSDLVSHVHIYLISYVDHLLLYDIVLSEMWLASLGNSGAARTSSFSLDWRLKIPLYLMARTLVSRWFFQKTQSIEFILTSSKFLYLWVYSWDALASRF